MTANERQVGGDHYKTATIEHWDYAASQNFDYFQGQITKYVARWRKKNGLKDLEKAQHFLEKYIEVEKKKTEYGVIKDLGRREMPPRVDNTGQKHPFGYNAQAEGCRVNLPK